MDQLLFKKLMTEIDWADWEILHSHFVHNSLFVLEQGEDIYEFAAAVTNNDVALVETKISQGLVGRPDGYDVEKWRKSGQRFLTLIVSPYVLIQCMEEAEYLELYKKRQALIDEA